MDQVHLLPLAALLALCSCGDPAPDTASADERPAERNPDAAVQASRRETMASGTLGKVNYSFDTRLLTRAEIDLPLPPDFTESVFAIKLIPIAYADNLGSPGCSYGISLDDETCTAEEEIGIALALLERPIADYRTEIEAENLSPGQIMTHKIAGMDSFTVRFERDPTRQSYTYMPVEERTLVIAQRKSEGENAASAALDEVIASLSLTGA